MSRPTDYVARPERDLAQPRGQWSEAGIVAFALACALAGAVLAGVGVAWALGALGWW